MTPRRDGAEPWTFSSPKPPVDSQAQSFVQTMTALIVVGILAFLISLIARHARHPDDATIAGRETTNTPHWPEVVLALGLLAVVASILFWQFAPQLFGESDATDWRGQPKALLFLVVMAAVAVIGGAAALVIMVPKPSKRPHGDASRAIATPTETTTETPSSARLLGLLFLAFAFLLLGWVYLPRSEQYALMHYLIYPSSFAVALVLLVDKATRVWSVKGAAETVREWLLADAITFLLVLGFLNLRSLAAGEAYASIFWDFLHIGLFFMTLWFLDRTTNRYRFLLAYGYLIVLALLLLAWQFQQEVPVVEDLTWWSTIWPFLFLALIFFVLEIIFLLASATAEQHTTGAIKDALFVVIYAILLIIAIPEASG